MKQGNLAWVKTTGEIVFILGGPDTNGIVQVRRPVATKSGTIEHHEDTFTLDELFGFEDKIALEVGNVIVEQKIRTLAKDEFEAWLEERKTEAPKAKEGTLLVN